MISASEEALLQAMPDAVLVIDAMGAVSFANHRAEGLFGYQAGRLPGLGVEQLMPRALQGRSRDLPFEAPRAAHGGVCALLTAQRADGRQFPVEFNAGAWAGDGKTRLLAVVRDVSENQTAAQQALRAGHDALVASIGQMALAASDPGQLIGELPALLARALGVESIAVAFRRRHPHAIARLEIVAGIGGLARSAGGGELVSLLEEGGLLRIDDHACTIAPGGPPSGELVGLPLRGRGGNIGAIIGWATSASHFDHDAMHLMRSVADLLSALLQRASSDEQLAHAQRIDAIGQLAGGLAHDFNNLLMVLSGNLEMLESRCQALPEMAALVGSARSTTAHGAELMNKMLAFARRQRLRPRSVDVAGLLADLAELLQGTLGEGFSIKSQCPEALPEVFADPVQLETALVSLALNARDAMPGGGEIRLRAEECWIAAGQAWLDLAPGHYLEVSVSDGGTGMDEETLARAIEPFFTTKAYGRGTGLGLSTAYGFARQSGGDLHIGSRPGQGTRVAIVLPVTRTGGTGDSVRT